MELNEVYVRVLLWFFFGVVVQSSPYVRELL
jgi:hypothetical protein